MRTTLLTLFLFLFALPVKAGSDGITFNPRGTSISQRILSYKSYEDIRIDSNLDGKTDEWFLRKGNVEIRISYRNGKKASIAISKNENKQFELKRYEFNNGKFTLTSHIQRPSLIMYGTPDECDKNELLSTKILQLSQDVSAITSPPNSCDVKQFPEFSKTIQKVFMSAPDGGVEIAECIQRAQNIKDVDLNIIAARLRASYDRISSGQANSIISCQTKSSGEFHGQTNEDGGISFVIPSSSKDPIVDGSKLEILLHHELLHAAGIKDETLASNMIKGCLEHGVFNNISSQNPSLTSNNVEGVINNHANLPATIAGQELTDSKAAKHGDATKKAAERNLASAAAKTGDGLDMKSEIANAEKIIPSAEKLNVAKVDKSPAGKEQALRDSVQESAPVFRMANQAMGISNTPALAESSSSGSGYSSSSSSTSSYASSGSSETGSSSRSSSSSSSGKRYQSRYGRYQSKGGVGADEYVAEEIDLTKNAESQAKKASNTTRTQASRTGTYQPATAASNEPATPNSRGPASIDPEVSTGRKGTSKASTNGGGGSIATGSAGGSADLNISSSSGGGGGTQSAQNRARSASSSGRSPASTNQQGSLAQRQEIMTTLTNNDYVLTKRKLKDPSFLNELEANNVKVVDANGSSWGARSGTTIYFDDGNRFIRQR